MNENDKKTWTATLWAILRYALTAIAGALAANTVTGCSFVPVLDF